MSFEGLQATLKERDCLVACERNTRLGEVAPLVSKRNRDPVETIIANPVTALDVLVVDNETSANEASVSFFQPHIWR